MTKFEQAKAFLAGREYHIRIYAGNPDRYQLWADGTCQADGISWDEMEAALDTYLVSLQGASVPREEMS